MTGTCSSTCGGGVKNVTRDCNNPRPQCGGKNCEGISFNTSPCSENCCPSKRLLCLYMCAWIINKLLIRNISLFCKSVML